VLALPRAPQRPLLAVATGRAAQREVGAQLFAGNAIRKAVRRRRADRGDQCASRARCPGGGELRMSLSSLFAPRDAEGFRCPSTRSTAWGDVATMLADLLADAAWPMCGSPPVCTPTATPGRGGSFSSSPIRCPAPLR
jgi:hypothetical protein